MESKKFTIETERNKLRAALIFAADKDIRFYLNSVCLHVDECGGARLVSTDGHRLAIITLGDYPAAAPGEYLIPRDSIKSIKKASGRSFNGVNIEIDADRFTLTAYDEILGGGKLIDGKFPDFQRVTPASVDDWSGQAATFNADYVHDIKRALVELGDKNGFFTMAQNGPNNAGLVVRADKGFLCVVMAMRGDDMPSAAEIAGFMPRRMPRAIIETASGGGAFPCDPLQDVGDKRGAVDAGQAPAVDAGQAAPIELKDCFVPWSAAPNAVPYSMFNDPGHGWLAVSFAELQALGIAEKITHYSYRRADIVYLEEDCDLTTFIRAKAARGERVIYSETFQQNTPIRNYSAYEAPSAPAAVEDVDPAYMEYLQSVAA